MAAGADSGRYQGFGLGECSIIASLGVGDSLCIIESGVGDPCIIASVADGDPVLPPGLPLEAPQAASMNVAIRPAAATRSLWMLMSIPPSSVNLPTPTVQDTGYGPVTWRHG